MQTIQFKVSDEYMQIILSLLNGLKYGIIEDLSIIKGSNIEELTNEQKDIFSNTAGILSSQNIDPIKWQNEIRNEWDR